MPITLIPINPTDRVLIATMVRTGSPRWMRMAACLALEGRRTVLPKDGHPVYDGCAACGAEGRCTVRAFHKDRDGGDARCLVECDRCGALVEDRPLLALEQNPDNPLKGIRDVF